MAGRAPQPPAVPQPPGGGHHHHHPYPYPYPYPYPHPVAAEGEGPEEEAEAFELRPRGREKVRRSASRDRPDDIVLLARDIQEGDTLNAIALQFCCSVSECLGGSGWRNSSKPPGPNTASTHGPCPQAPRLLQHQG